MLCQVLEQRCSRQDEIMTWTEIRKNSSQIK